MAFWELPYLLAIVWSKQPCWGLQTKLMLQDLKGLGGEGPLLVFEPVFAFRLDANKCAGERILLESQRDGIDDGCSLTVEEACMIHFVMKAASKDPCSCLWHSVFLPLQSAHGKGRLTNPAAFWISLALVSKLRTPLQCGGRVIPSGSGHR